ncbi:MAG: bifunctional precorrin-2 dehydrogenase/sirohydrochlorin ferrochelatase [Actinomycetota bacterium]|nr:bifunctional precorrin-2 dehydrogenase/sirohydrochlorin ferrochelatase [Actinomycetota bacterium]
MERPEPSYPVALRLAGRPCLVVGGGELAAHKAAGLLAARAAVTVVAEEPEAAMRALAVRLLERPYRRTDLAGCWLAFAASGSAALDRAIFADAEAAGVFCNVPDDLSACAFHLPAIARAGSVSIAVSSDGTSPALSSLVRDELALGLGDAIAQVADVLGETRATLRQEGHPLHGLPWRALATELVKHARRGSSLAALMRCAEHWKARASPLGDLSAE